MPQSPLQGEIAAVLSGVTPGTLVTTRLPSITLTWAGVEGDLHAGVTRAADARNPYYQRGGEMRSDRQVTLVSEEELADVAKALGIARIRPEWVGANLLVRGIPDLSALLPNTRLFLSGGAALVVMNENLPCAGPGREIQLHYPAVTGLESAFPKAAMHKRGLVACVDRPGLLKSGETFTLDLPKGLAWMAPGNRWSAG